MLQASRLKATEGKPLTIAGASAGKRVRCSPQALPVYNELVALANAGNYWAGLVVKGIKGLSAGRLQMDNIYVRKAEQLACGRGVFYLVLPGVTATLEDRDSGAYELMYLQADSNYMQMQEKTRKPGLWKIDKDLNTNPKFKSDGLIEKEKYRPVVISDRSSDDLLNIASSARDDLIKVDSTIQRMVSNSGFDLHHTPGDGGIIGLKPAHKALANAKSTEITESAILLANTMYKARNIEGVLWFSDWGGSGVLTRALQVLAHEKNTKLEKHAVFLNRPTTNSSNALKLAKELKLSLAGNGGTGKSTGLRPSEIAGNHLRSPITGKGVLDSSIFGLSAAGATFGFMGVAPTIGGIVGLMGALYFVTTTARSGATQLSGKKYK
ncbi:hypothetical protein P886_1238 [Alteromonadaceae bacterium 2753L.S.0a.02]|nr:hypothetical protein P886_1238 [Alteromonadaceae bacterium 2753L.S.0a.02]